ncbi:MAG TPA: TolC family protein, partial [Chitinophagaceae bacterium]|nr:TolC family protein [Chitinophagaceae bacterium]
MLHNKIDMKKLLTVICLIVCIVSAASAQKMLTLEEAIATALQYNYDIRVAKNDSLLYDLNQSYAYAAFLPRLNANSAIVFNSNDLKQQLADGSIRQQKGIRSDNTQASLNLNWTLFDGLKMFATRDKINEFVTLGKLTIRNQLVNTIANVINTYYDIVRQKQQLKAIEEQMGINEELVLQAEKKLSVGLAAKPELLQAKIDLNAQKAAKLTQLTLIEQLKEQLNEWMAVAPGSSYDVADSIPINMNLSAGEILAASAVSNPAIEVAQQQIKIASLTLKERKADRFPVIQFNSAYNFSRT